MTTETEVIHWIEFTTTYQPYWCSYPIVAYWQHKEQGDYTGPMHFLLPYKQIEEWMDEIPSVSINHIESTFDCVLHFEPSHY